MSTTGQFNAKNPTIKRILKEASELTHHPSADYHAIPVSDSNLFEWHFTLRGPPAPSPFASGIYHGRIVLPPQYPLRPPSFRFLTPSGRFEPNREICLSISGHHEESWQPAWGIRTALVAIRSFMDSEAKGQLGGVDAKSEVRERLAGESRSWKCPACGGKSCEQIMAECEEEITRREKEGKVTKKDEDVPEELRLGYRDEMEADKKKKAEEEKAGMDEEQPEEDAPSQGASTEVKLPNSPLAPSPPPVASLATSAQPVPATGISQTNIRRVQVMQPPSHIPGWIDLAIGGLAAALVLMVLRKILSVT